MAIRVSGFTDGCNNRGLECFRKYRAESEEGMPITDLAEVLGGFSRDRSVRDAEGGIPLDLRSDTINWIHSS